MTCGKTHYEQLKEAYRGYAPSCDGDHNYHYHPPTTTMRCTDCFHPMSWDEKNRRLRTLNADGVAKLAAERTEYREWWIDERNWRRDLETANKVLWQVLKDCGIATTKETNDGK